MFLHQIKHVVFKTTCLIFETITSFFHTAFHSFCCVVKKNSVLEYHKRFSQQETFRFYFWYQTLASLKKKSLWEVTA